MDEVAVSAKIMDDKKTQVQKDSFSVKKIFNFVGDIKSEFKKITWTDKEELKVYTKVVVSFTFVFGMAVLFADIMIQKCLAGLNIAIRLITG